MGAKRDVPGLQRMLNELAALRSLSGSSAGAQQSAPHGSAARRDLAANTAATGSEAQKLRDELIEDGILTTDGQLTPEARDLGLRPGIAFIYRP